MATRSAFEVEPRLPASSLLLWASPAQAKQTLLQKRRRVDAPCVGFPSRRARVQAEPTSCRRSECGWAAGKPVAGARHAVRRRCGSQGERLWLAKKVERGVSQIRIVSHFFHPSLWHSGLRGKRDFSLERKMKPRLLINCARRSRGRTARNRFLFGAVPSFLSHQKIPTILEWRPPWPLLRPLRRIW